MPVRSIDIGAPAHIVWKLISEFEYWPAWGPTVSGVRSESTTVAPGVSGQVRTPVGLWISFVITEVDPGRSWYWRVAGVPATGHRVVPTGDNSCRLAFSVPWPFLPYVTVLRAGLRRVASLAREMTA